MIQSQEENEKPGWPLEPMTWEDKLMFGLIACGIIALVGGVGYLGWLVIDFNSK